jgi:hypothetical protein
MTLLPAFMLTLTLAVLLTVTPRFVLTCFHFRELAEGDCKEALSAMLQQENGWVARHFVCAMAGTVLVALMKTMPSLNPPEYLAAITTGYVLVSFTFALAESLLALKIAPLLKES